MGRYGYSAVHRSLSYVRHDMEEKKFFRLLLFIVVICAIITLAHFGYDVWAYKHASIITFIAKELW